METNTNFKRVVDRHQNLGEVLKRNPLKPYVRRTNMKPVGSINGFNFHAITTPAPAYLMVLGFNPNFDKVKQDLLDNIEMVKAKITYEKMLKANQRQAPRLFGGTA